MRGLSNKVGLTTTTFCDIINEAVSHLDYSRAANLTKAEKEVTNSVAADNSFLYNNTIFLECGGIL